MQSLATSDQIAFKLSEDETLEFILAVEELVKTNVSVGQSLAEYFINGQESNPFSESRIEVKASQIDAKNFENSRIEAIIFSGKANEEDFEITLSAESVMQLGALEKYKVEIINQSLNLNIAVMDFEHFKQYSEEHELGETFNKLMESQLILSFPYNEALVFLLSKENSTPSQLEAFINSEFFTTEDSPLVITKENFIISDKEQLLSLLARPLSEDAQKVMVNRFLEQNPSYPEVMLASVLGEMLDQFDSYQDFKEKLHHRRLIISLDAYKPVQRISLELNEMTQGQALLEFIKAREVKNQEIVDYIFREDALAGIGEVIVARREFIVINHLELFRVTETPVIAEQPEVVQTLVDRYEAWGSKDRQIELAVEFQNYYHGEAPKDAETLSSLIEKSTVLYALAKNIDPAVKTGVFKKFAVIEDCEFDSQGFPLVKETKINSILSMAIQKLAAPQDLLLYVHNEERISADKIYYVVKHPNCPMSLLLSYAEQPNFFPYLLANPALPQEVIEEMVKHVNKIGQDSNILDLITKHPNCPPELAEMIKAGPVGYLQKLFQSDSEDWLAEQARLLIVYPLNWPHPFELEMMQKHNYLSEIMGNKHTALHTLEQLLEYYQGFETDPDEFCTQLREKILKRKDCPSTLIHKMSRADEPVVRSQLIDSEHFNQEEIINDMLEMSIEELKEVRGEQKLSSPRILLGDMTEEMKKIVTKAPKFQMVLRDQVLKEIKKDIEVTSDVRYFKPLYRMIAEGQPILKTIEIPEQDKGELLALMRNKYKEMPRMGARV